MVKVKKANTECQAATASLCLALKSLRRLYLRTSFPQRSDSSFVSTVAACKKQSGASLKLNTALK
jgi:hypothetical protein